MKHKLYEHGWRYGELLDKLKEVPTRVFPVKLLVSAPNIKDSLRPSLLQQRS